MQVYNMSFAEVYNSEFSGFATRVSPIIESFYAHTDIGRDNRQILDLCCGTGQLANFFANKEYCITGIDASEHMLKYAFDNNREYVNAGRVKFLQSDISDFDLSQSFGLVVSTYDSINHIESDDLLKRCFTLVFQVLLPDGYFIFDLNTRKSLLNWNSIQIIENDKLFMVSRGIYDGYANKALIRISGFVRTTDALYKKFDQTIVNSVFDLEYVRSLLIEIGWREVHFTKTENLEVSMKDPESMNVKNGICIVARK